MKKKKGCAIGLLNAMEVLDYERENHKEHLQTLQTLEDNASTKPLYYMWMNVTCHDYILSEFNIDRMALPSMVYYHPKHEKFGWLVGRFQTDVLKDHEDQFLKGKLPLR